MQRTSSRSVRFDRHALSISLGIVSAYFFLLALPALLESASFGRGEVHSDADSMVSQLPDEIVMVLTVFVLILFLGWTRSCRLTTPIRWRALWLLLPPLLFAAALLALGLIAGMLSPGGLALDGDLLMQLVIFVLLVGVFEETLFRGILFHGIEVRHGTVMALVLSSLGFGAMHYVNWIAGQPFQETTVQVLHAAGGGFLYAMLMLRLGSIWPAIFTHAFWDATVSIVSTVTAHAATANAEQAAQVATDPGVLALVLNVLVMGFEPAYGLVLFAFWWRRSDRVS